ncbi:MAG: MFS transporter [Promethearchaeati archaeon]
MKKVNKSETEEYSTKGAIAYSFGHLSLITSYQSFSYLVFTFYFAVIGIDVNLMTIGYLIWSIWNAFNDPIMGYISDRTHTKYGRRRPYIMAFLLPLALTMFFLFFAPKSYGITDQISNFIYFTIIILIFEFCYTTYDINISSTFPEVFITEASRVKANNVRQIFTIIGLIFAFIMPTFFIEDFSDPAQLSNFHLYGIILVFIIIAIGLIFLLFTPRERKEFQEDYLNVPKFWESFKICLKSKSFRWALPAFIGAFYIESILPTIVPLFGKYVLNIEDSMFQSIMLGITFISAAIFVNFLWKPVVKKVGVRMMWIISSIIWIVTLIPVLFINDRWSGLIVFFLFGIGLAGSLYAKALIISDIIDEDELNTGTRRDASYFGIYIFFLRIGYIFVFLSINLVFNSVGWKLYVPETITSAQIFGLKLLGSIFPIIALIIVILAMYKYPLHGEYLKSIQRKLDKIHLDKKNKFETRNK